MSKLAEGPTPSTLLPLTGHAIFLSASIPDSTRWDGDFDPLEITDAVVAATRMILTAGGTVVSAAHPTIAPLLLYVAAEHPASTLTPSVVVYQSRLFEDVLPTEIRLFNDGIFGEVRLVEASPGDRAEPGLWGASLSILRDKLFSDTAPSAAFFIGGMQGVVHEFALFQERFPGRPMYALGRPGGESRQLASQRDVRLRADLLAGDVYPALFRRVLRDLVAVLSASHFAENPPT